ncbi:ABC1 kinase family protein [Aporhodopirellula aestuarii]|uniref:AarF/UbiB family protein n=1 Tax=Aporhodopirellula aestuarii TaxID=2950107 RepID=A0ABT0U9Z1_9BACT|nr:AarF/UbiB family protein [Aporhodopirellula aestuarii]MCM2373696.1 AarF/UbiB family protein [Aporhodopirellula aestuarii]
MLKELATDSYHYSKLSALLWKHGCGDLAGKLGWSNADAGDPEKERSAQSLAEDIERLGTAYIKLAQIASTRQDLLPPEYIEALGRLQDDVEPVPWEDIEQAIIDGLGVKPSKLFASISHEPLATASIGQVHRAKLHDGREVVVKVRRPGIAEEAIEQIESLKRLARMVDDKTDVGKKFRFCSLVGAVEYALTHELDYRLEANHLQHLAENLEAFDRIVVPLPIPQMVCSSVLVMQYLTGAAIKDVSGVVLNELDTDVIADQLVRAYLQQILVDGLFHADPHPGNLFLHEGNRIGLLDGGMVVTLPPMLRREIAALLLAFSEDEGERSATLATRIGTTDEGFDSQAFRRAAARVVTGSGDNNFNSMSLGRTLVEFLNVAGEHGLVLPFEMILLSKAFLQLETTLAQLSPRQDAKRLIRGYTFELLSDRAKEQLSIGQIAASALDSAELASNLPSRLNQITRLAAENQLRLKVDSIDEKALLAGMRKIANRITSGLIVAAMIVGASLIMRLDTGAQLLGYPVLATIFFLASAAIGAVLLWQAMFSDEH